MKKYNINLKDLQNQLNKNFSIIIIAKNFKCSRYTIRNRIKKYNLIKKSPKKDILYWCKKIVNFNKKKK